MSNLQPNATSPQSQITSLPTAWIDKLFHRFHAMYGRLWLDTWAGIPMDDVKQTWAEDLARFDGDTLRKALDHVRTNNKFPPTCPEFVGICKAFLPSPAGHLATLPAPRNQEDIDPSIRAEIAKWLTPNKPFDPKGWAREILSLAKDGQYPHVHGIHCAKVALGLEYP